MSVKNPNDSIRSAFITANLGIPAQIPRFVGDPNIDLTRNLAFSAARLPLGVALNATSCREFALNAR